LKEDTLNLKTLTWFDWLWPLFALIPSSVLAMAFFHNEDLASRALFVGVGLLFWVCSLPMMIVRFKVLTSIKYVTASGIRVRWTDEKYAVSECDVEAIAQETLQKYVDLYFVIEAPKKKSLEELKKVFNGIVVTFREFPFANETYKTSATGKAQQLLTGLQDGCNVHVGWLPDLAKTALEHELGHIILSYGFNILGGTFGESTSDPHHKIMKKHGLR
jgi:hypothetical protein